MLMMLLLLLIDDDDDDDDAVVRCLTIFFMYHKYVCRISCGCCVSAVTKFKK